MFDNTPSTLTILRIGNGIIYLGLARCQIDHGFGDDDGRVHVALSLIDSGESIQSIDVVGISATDISLRRADALLSKLSLDGAVCNRRH